MEKQQQADGCGCPQTELPKSGGVNHVFLTVNDLARSRKFYSALMPRIGYPDLHDFGTVSGWAGAGGSFWLKQADKRYAEDTFSKDRVGLCEVAFGAQSRAQIDMLAKDIEGFGGLILNAPKEYPEYVKGYYAVFFTDPDGIKLEVVHIPA